MATLGIEPPSYHPPLGSGHTDNEPPEYSRNAAADERIVLSQPTAPQPSTTDVREYHFHSERLELNVGPTKYYPVKVPCYGWNGVVKGTVVVKDFKAVTKVTVALGGVVRASVIERGMSVYSTTKTLFVMPQILWSRSENATAPEESTSFLFSFQLPTYAQETSIRLPHSYAASHTGLSAEVTYELRVDLFRKGLRRHERLKTMILYLPRSTPPEAPFRRHDVSDAFQDVVEWDSTAIYPKRAPVAGKVKEGEGRAEEDPAEAINLILPLPKAYVSAAPIPFYLSFPADSPFLPYVFTHLSVYLIKHTTIRAGGFFSFKDGVIGLGEIWHVDDGSYPTSPPSPPGGNPSFPTARKVYRGTLKSFREGGETSWNIPDFLEIRYLIRVRMRVPDAQHEGKPLPEYMFDQPVQMCTHPRIPDAEDLHEPVIGLIAVSGSQGLPTNRPVRPGAFGSS